MVRTLGYAVPVVLLFAFVTLRAEPGTATDFLPWLREAAPSQLTNSDSVPESDVAALLEGTSLEGVSGYDLPSYTEAGTDRGTSGDQPTVMFWVPTDDVATVIGNARDNVGGDVAVTRTDYDADGNEIVTTGSGWDECLSSLLDSSRETATDWTLCRVRDDGKAVTLVLRTAPAMPDDPLGDLTVEVQVQVGTDEPYSPQ